MKYAPINLKIGEDFDVNTKKLNVYAIIVYICDIIFFGYLCFKNSFCFQNQEFWMCSFTKVIHFYVILEHGCII